MHLEVFAEGNSPIHSLEPRIKLLAFAPFVLVTAVACSGLGVVMSLAIGLLLVVLSRLDLKELAVRMLMVNVFVLMLWLVLPFTRGGETAFILGPLRATFEGLHYVGIITMKVNALVLVTIALVSTVPVFKLTSALEKMWMPAKLVVLFFFCYRYISVLHEEYEGLIRAMKVRGFIRRTSMHCYRSYANLIGMLIVKSYEHSQEIYRAMICRGFRGHYPVLGKGQMPASRDYSFLFLMLVLTAGLLAIERMG